MEKLRLSEALDDAWWGLMKLHGIDWCVQKDGSVAVHNPKTQQSASGRSIKIALSKISRQAFQ